MAKKPTVKMPKLPKSLGACVDLYYDEKQTRLEAAKSVAVLKEREDFVKDHIINNVPKGDSGAIGQRYKGVVYTDTIYVVEDWDKLYKHLKKTGEFDLLNRALNQAAVKDRVEAQERPRGKRGENWKPKLPPGVGTFNAVKLSVTKVK